MSTGANPGHPTQRRLELRLSHTLAGSRDISTTTLTALGGDSWQVESESLLCYTRSLQNPHAGMLPRPTEKQRAVCPAPAFLQRRRWRPTPVLLPGKSHGWRSLVGCSPWSREESDTTEQLHFDFSLSYIGRRKWQPTPVFLLEESQGWESLMGCHLWAAQSRTRLTRLSSSSSSSPQPAEGSECLCRSVLVSPSWPPASGLAAGHPSTTITVSGWDTAHPSTSPSSGCLLEGLMLKLKLQYSGPLMQS